jgi:hypothetical protein
MGSKLIQIKWKLKTQWDLQKWNIAGRLSWAQCTMNACRVASFLLTDVKSYLKIEHNTIIAGRAWVWNSQPHCIAVIISSWSNAYMMFREARIKLNGVCKPLVHLTAIFRCYVLYLRKMIRDHIIWGL